MTRSSLRSLSMTAVAGAMLLSASAPAFAQENPPPAAGSVPPPMQAMAAPKGSEDMTGSIGFGVGVVAGAQTLVQIAPGNLVALKYWLSDALAVSPALSFNIAKPSGPGTATTWDFSPSVVALYSPFRSTSTRFSVGGGLGFSVGKTPTAANPSPPTDLRIFIPIQAGVEHFFTRWFSTGIAAQSNLIDYQKDNSFGVHLNTFQLLGSIFFYTD
jgi:hypothetical protein